MGAYGENDGADVVLKARGADSLLVSLGGTGLLGKNETGSDPDAGSTKHKSSSKRVTVEQTTSSNNLDGLLSEGADLAFTDLGNGGNENRRGNVTSVTTTLATLGADDIGTDINGLLRVLGVTNHVHV